jgi:hypothetical protein
VGKKFYVPSWRITHLEIDLESLRAYYGYTYKHYYSSHRANSTLVGILSWIKFITITNYSSSSHEIPAPRLISKRGQAPVLLNERYEWPNVRLWNLILPRDLFDREIKAGYSSRQFNGDYNRFQKTIQLGLVDNPVSMVIPWEKAAVRVKMAAEVEGIDGNQLVDIFYSFETGKWGWS